jgi:hypothetical protein
MAKELDGTFLTDFNKRELALSLLSALHYLNESGSYAELQGQVRIDDSELEDLRAKLTEFFDDF